MEMLLLVLFSMSAILFFLSFFMKDRTKLLEKELEIFTMNFTQEIFLLKKKISILEEEILFHTEKPYFGVEKTPSLTDQLLEEVMSHYNNGYSIDEISKLTSLSENEVLRLIATATQEG